MNGNPLQSKDFKIFVHDFFQLPLNFKLYSANDEIATFVITSSTCNIVSYLSQANNLDLSNFYIFIATDKEIRFIEYSKLFIDLKNLIDYSQKNLQVFVVYSETEILRNQKLQEYFLSKYPEKRKLNDETLEIIKNYFDEATTTSTTKEKKSVSSDPRFKKNQKILESENKGFYLTKFASIKSISFFGENSFVFCLSPMTLPFSKANGLLKEEDYLKSPCYLTQKLLKANFDSKKMIREEQKLNEMIELQSNKKRFVISKENKAELKGIFSEIVKQYPALIFTGRNIKKAIIPTKAYCKFTESY